MIDSGARDPFPWIRRAPWTALAPWIEGAVLASVVLAILAFGGEAARASYHGFLHAALGEAVLRGGLAPENPYHAGDPLRYYTLYPLLGALIGRAGCGPLWAFALLDVLAALLLPPALDALGRALGLPFRARRAAFLAAALAFNGLGWIGLLAIEGPAPGAPPVYALKPMTFASEWFGWDARVQAFLPKFLNVSSYAIALPFGLWALAIAARDGVRDPRAWRDHASFAASLALSLALNPLVGGFAGACAALWLAPEAWRSGWRRRGEWALAFLAAGALALPFLVPALHPAPEGTSLTGKVALGGHPWSNLLGPLLVLLPAGLLGLASLSPAARGRFLVAALLSAVLVLLGEMPQGNEYKMSRLSGLFWALPAGAWAARVRDSRGTWRWAPAALLLASLPTTIAVPWFYLAWSRRAAELPLAVERGVLVPRARELRALFESEARFDPRAVVLLDPAFPGAKAEEGLVQGDALAPALHHPLFVDVPQIHNDRLPDLQARLDLLESVYGMEADEAVSDALGGVRATLPDRPFLVFAEESDPKLGAALARAGGSLVARTDEASLWSLRSLSP